MAPGSDSPKATFEHKSLESADTHATCSRGAVGSREWARCVPGAVFRARVAAVGTRRVRVHTRLFTSARCPSDPAAGLQVTAPGAAAAPGRRAGGESGARGPSASGRQTSFDQTPRGGSRPFRPAAQRRQTPRGLPKSSEETASPQPGSADGCPLRCLAFFKSSGEILS